MASANINSQASLAGVPFSASMRRTADISAGYAPETPLPAAKPGMVTTKTDADTGVLTMDTGHGLTTGMKVDVYWAAGIRYGMTATVSGDAVTVDGGAGDDLPDVDEPVTVSEQVVADLADFDGDLLELLAVWMQRRGHVQFRQAGGINALAREQPAQEAYVWAARSGIANPLAAKNVVQVAVSNGDAAGTSDVKIGMLLHSA